MLRLNKINLHLLKFVTESYSEKSETNFWTLYHLVIKHK